jgi:hypothetical protein
LHRLSRLVPSEGIETENTENKTLKTGEKLQTWLTPYRKEDWARKSAVSFDSTREAEGMRDEG